ncbi:MAG TPA: DMT family transporter [Burkholderiales bacterium]|jgi:drug/metabolite transporter (DMT)-like permease|nr:DMT family transporter [Burkholderiales bacterium]
MRLRTWLVLIATLLLWSGNWIVARAVREEISPGLATVGRLIVVLAILAPFAWRGLAAKLPALGRREWLIIAGLGLTGGGPHLGLQWLGLHYTTAASGILYLSTTPIFILLLTAALGERIVARQWGGVAISFAGVFLIATQGHPERLSFNRGDLMAIGSMMLWAGYTVLLRVRRDPLEVIELLCMVCAFGAMFMTPWLLWEAAGGARLALSKPGTLAIVYSAIGSLLLAYAGWSYVVARLGAARAGVTLHLMPAFGVLLSMLFLGEYPHWFHFAGMALILAGVFTASYFGNPAASSSRP